MVSEIDTGLVLKTLEPIWWTTPESANRIRGRIEVILDWAKVRGYRDGENPARWRGHLDKTLPRPGKVKAVTHHAALPYREMAGFMAELQNKEGVSARALEFTILTAARTSETVGAKWAEISEVEFENDADQPPMRIWTWTRPAERMKAKKEHRVPLSDRALTILKELPRESDYIFPGAQKDESLSDQAMLELLRGMRGMGSTVHGFRSSFRDWAGDQTSYPNEMCELALAHAARKALVCPRDFEAGVCSADGDGCAVRAIVHGGGGL